MALSRKAKKFIWICVAVAIVGVCVNLFSIWWTFTGRSDTNSVKIDDLPTELREPRVLVGEGFLSKRDLFHKQVMAPASVLLGSVAIRDEIERDRYINDEFDKRRLGFSDIRQCGDQIIAVGEFGGYKLGSDGALIEPIVFERRFVKEFKGVLFNTKYSRRTTDNIRILDVEGDGQCEFVSYGTIDGVAFFDHKGKAVWRYGDDPTKPVDGVGIADVNDDGNLDFIVVRHHDGFRAIGADGRDYWFQPTDYFGGRFVFPTKDSDTAPNQMIELVGRRALLRDKATGQVIGDLDFDGAPNGFVEVSGTPSGSKLLAYDLNGLNSEGLMLTDFKGNVIFKTNARLSQFRRTFGKPYEQGLEYARPTLRLVHLRANEPKYFVMLGSFESIPRANVYVYDSHGQLVYHELLSEDAKTFTIVPNVDGSESFLVGGKDTIWKYSIN